MKTANDIYFQIEKLNRDVKDKLRGRGIVVPIKRNDSIIQLGRYYIKKISKGFYNIVDHKQRPILEGINLPQTAIIIANKLELGKWIDTDLLQNDKKYGFAVFDEQLHKQSTMHNIKKRDYDRAELMYDKSVSAARKKEYYKKLITTDFQKLIEFR